MAMKTTPILMLLLQSLGGNQGMISHELPRRAPGGHQPTPHHLLLTPTPHSLSLPHNLPLQHALVPNGQHEERKNYEFGYAVKDAYGDDHSHKESRDGYMTKGEYRVSLPDGRIQIVTYYADHEGYHADVKYEGVEHFPAPGAQPAPYSAPIHHASKSNIHYTPTPVVHHAPTPVAHYTPTPVVHHAPTPVAHYNPTPVAHYTPTPVVHHAPTPVHHGSHNLIHRAPAPYHTPTTHHNKVYKTSLKFSNPSAVMAGKNMPEKSAVVEKVEVAKEESPKGPATIVKQMPKMNSIHFDEHHSQDEVAFKSLPLRNKGYSPYTPKPVSYTPKPVSYTPKPVYHSTINPLHSYHHAPTTPRPVYHPTGAPAYHGPTTPSPVYHPTGAPAYHSTPAPAYHHQAPGGVHHGPLHHVTTVAPPPHPQHAAGGVPIYHSTIKPVSYHHSLPSVHHSVKPAAIKIADNETAASSRSLPPSPSSSSDSNHHLYRSRIVVKGSSDTSPTALPAHMRSMARMARYRPGPAIKLEDESIVPQLVSY